MTFTIWNITLLKNEPFMSNRRFKKGTFFEKKSIFVFLLSYFCTLFSKNWTFWYSTTFFESLMTHKRFIFEESYISYGKRQKSCTLIVIWVKCLYLTSPTLNSSAKSNRLFLLQRRKYFVTILTALRDRRCMPQETEFSESFFRTWLMCGHKWTFAFCFVVLWYYVRAAN